jgi:hypothetical protein
MGHDGSSRYLAGALTSLKRPQPEAVTGDRKDVGCSVAECKKNNDRDRPEMGQTPFANSFRREIFAEGCYLKGCSARLAL